MRLALQETAGVAICILLAAVLWTGAKAFSQERAVPVVAQPKAVHTVEHHIAQPPASARSIYRATPDCTQGAWVSLPPNAAAQNAVLSVTQVWNPGGAGGIYNAHPVGVARREGRWAIGNLDGKTMPDGAAFAVDAQPPGERAFVHEARQANIQGNWTVIDSPACNDKPDAVLFVTPLAATDAAARAASHPIGVWYTQNRWAIYHQDMAPMTAGEAFHVTLQPAVLHKATEATIHANHTLVDDPALNGKPDLAVQATHIWNPPGSGGTYVRSPLGVWYTEGKWSVFTQDLSAMPAGAVFGLRIGTPTVAPGATPPNVSSSPRALPPPGTKPLPGTPAPVHDLGVRHGSPEDKLRGAIDRAVGLLLGNHSQLLSNIQAELLSKNKAELFSKDKAELFSKNKTELLSGNKAELLSGNKSVLLSKNKAVLFSGNKPEILSGNQMPIFSNDRTSILSNNKFGIRIVDSGNNNGAPGTNMWQPTPGAIAPPSGSEPMPAIPFPSPVTKPHAP